jgi:ATP adenylyltransferase
MPERLWATWRIAYIEQTKKVSGKECIFDALPRESNDRENLILYRGKTAFIILNAFPYTNGHLMVVPYKHTEDMSALSDEELLEVNQLVAKSISWLKKAYNPDGFNIGLNLGDAAGAGIKDHIHWHVVPRWSGDTNFMSVTADTRVMPESLQSTYDRIKRAIEHEHPNL